MRKSISHIIAGIMITTIFLIAFTGCSKTDEVKTVTPPPITPPPVVPPVIDTPLITSVTPLKALPTSQITIYGSKFSEKLTDLIVTVNGIAATVDSASATEVVFTLPANATSGKIELTSGGVKANYSNIFTVVHPYMIGLFAYDSFEHVAIDGDGNAYGDGRTGNNSWDSVRKVTPSGVVQPFATIPSGNLYGIAVDKEGNVYEANLNGIDCIYKITPMGSISILAGGSSNGYADGQGSAAEFSALWGLAIDAKGNLYTNDNHYIRKITPGGLVSTLAGSGKDGHTDGPALSASFGHTEGIAVDAKGNVFVSDNAYFNIRKISPSGVVTTLAGNGTAGLVDGTGKDAEFYFPQGMAIDAAGNIFLSDSEDDIGPTAFTVRMITPDGVVTTFLTGTGYYAPVAQIPYASASITYPDGLAFDSSGNMYICELLGYLQTIKLTFK